MSRIQEIILKKIIIIILVFLSILPIYSQTGYVLHVSASSLRGNLAIEISYTGDYTGIGTTSFDIGPYDEPFTVTLTIPEESLIVNGGNTEFVYWNIGDNYDELVTVTVDDTHPEVDVVAVYVNLEPSPPAPTDPPYFGYMFLSPVKKIVDVSEAFTWDLYANTGPKRLAAYGVDITWPVPRDGIIMTVDTSIGLNGVEAGVDGFVSAVNADNSMGKITISGFDVNGTAPSDNLHLCTINFIAGPRVVTDVEVSVITDKMVDPDTIPIGWVGGFGGTLQIKIFLGDVNGDRVIDIIDALLVAQYYVELNPSAFTSPVEAGDSNQDGTVDIVDALIIAQYYVGLCACPYFPPL